MNGTLFREAPNGSLYLVTGCDKATTWGAASISCASETNALSLKFTAARAVEASATFTYSWETYCPATVRIGPELLNNQERLQNQCVFLRGFKMLVREGSIAALKGTAKVTSILDTKPSNLLPGAKGNHVPFTEGRKRSWLGKSSGHGSSGDGKQRIHGSMEIFADQEPVLHPMKTRPWSLFIIFHQGNNTKHVETIAHVCPPGIITR